MGTGRRRRGSSPRRRLGGGAATTSGGSGGRTARPRGPRATPGRRPHLGPAHGEKEAVRGAVTGDRENRGAGEGVAALTGLPGERRLYRGQRAGRGVCAGASPSVGGLCVRRGNRGRLKWSSHGECSAICRSRAQWRDLPTGR
jgi:hypothetical protein